MSSTSPQEQTDSQARILKNTSFLTGAFILQKVISFLYFVFIARRIGPVDLGLYDPLKSLIPILLILIDFSLSAVMTREIARAPEKASHFVGNIIAVKGVFALAVMFIVGLVTVLGNFDTQTRNILYVVGMIVVLDTFTLTFFAVFRGLQNLLFESIAIIVNQVLTIGFGATALLLGWGLKGLFLATLLGSVFNFVFSTVILKRKAGIVLMPRWDKETIKTFLKMALPFAIAAMLVKAFSYTDRYLLLGLAGKQYVGWYITAHKLTFALEFIPSAFAASIYPAFSALYISSKEMLARTFEKSMHYLMILSLPLSAGVISLSDRLIKQLYTEAFTAAEAPLRIMISGLVVIFLNFPVGALLNATNRQSKNTLNMGITVIVNVGLNLLLIPKYTFIGAAVSTLISTSLLFTLGFIQVRKIIPVRVKFLALVCIKALTASAAMAVIVRLVAQAITFDVTTAIPTVGSYVQIILFYGLLALIGSAVYVGLIFALRAMDFSDVRKVVSSFRHRKQ